MLVKIERDRFPCFQNLRRNSDTAFSSRSDLFDLLSQFVVLFCLLGRCGTTCPYILGLNGGIAGADRYQEKKKETEPRQYSFQQSLSLFP